MGSTEEVKTLWSLSEEFDKSVGAGRKVYSYDQSFEASKLKRTGINLQANVFKKQKITDVPDVTKDESVKREEEFKVQQPILRYNIRKSLARKGLKENKSQSERKLLHNTLQSHVAFKNNTKDKPQHPQKAHNEDTQRNLKFTSEDQISSNNDDNSLTESDVIIWLVRVIHKKFSFPPMYRKLKIYEAKKDKSSIDEPPEVELKDLPPHLEYAFLEGTDKLPVIIAKDLKDEEKAALIKVLKSYKRAIA
ncbi:hypothetical protein Tco_1303113 [Tanacetum coccineum]